MSLKDIYDAKVSRAESMLKLAKAEGRELSAAEIMEKDTLFSDIRALKKTMEGDRSAARVAFAASNFGQKSKAELELERPTNFDGGTVNGEHRKIFNEWIRTGDTRELFTITSGTASGALVPTTVSVPTIVRRNYNVFEQALAVTGYSVIDTGDTSNLTIPIADDTAVTGDTPAEDASSDTETDPTISSVTLGATLYSSKSIWLSETVLNANTFDLAAYCMPILEKRLSLAMDAAWSTALTALNASGNRVVAASAAGFTYDELVSVYHKLPVPYRSDGVWIVSDSFAQAIRGLKDSENRPLFNMLDPLMGAGAIGSLMGRPLCIGNNMPAIGANAVTAAFVSGEALKIRMAQKRLARYVNVPTFPDQLGLRLFQNADAKFVAAGVAFLKMGAS